MVRWLKNLVGDTSEGRGVACSCWRAQLFPVVLAEIIVSRCISKLFNGREVGSGPFPFGRACGDRPVGPELFPVWAVEDEMFN